MIPKVSFFQGKEYIKKMRKCKKVDILDDFSREVDDTRKAQLSVFKKKNEEKKVEFFNAETLLIENAVYCGSKTKGGRLPFVNRNQKFRLEIQMVQLSPQENFPKMVEILKCIPLFLFQLE